MHLFTWMKKRPFLTTMLILILSIIGMIFIGLATGPIRISPLEVVQTLFQQGSAKQELILFDFRLPGIILAVLIGAGLAVSGAILQGITQNELADPGILGVNTGAGLAIVLFMFFFRDVMDMMGAFSIYIMPLFALMGAIGAAVLIYIIAWNKGVNPVRLVLVGIGINAGFSAALVIFQLKMDPQDYRQATVWLMGDIWSANWTFVFALLPWMLILIPYALHKARTLNSMTLGDSVASGLGIQVERERMILLFVAVALAGASVAAGGGIAFLGLVVPHIARKIIGPMHQFIIPISALIGALLLLGADTISKNITSINIPIGIIVSILSIPYFVYLLIKTK